MNDKREKPVETSHHISINQPVSQSYIYQTPLVHDSPTSRTEYPKQLTVPAMVGAARSDRKEEWESDSGATFHMSHTHAGMSAYKKASPGTNVEIADGNILPVDGFGRIEVDLDQLGHTTKVVKMDDVAYVPGLSRNLLSTIKAVEEWADPEAGGSSRGKFDGERIGEDRFGNGAGDESGGIS